MMLDVGLFAFLAVIHILPAVAAVAPSRLVSLYGIDAQDSALVTLLKHRAVLLGLVGLGFAAAAFHPGHAIAWHAALLGGASMISFLIIAAFNRELSGSLKTIAIVDAIGILPLAALFVRQPWAQSF